MSKFKLTQTAAEVQGILNNSLQKPTGLTKTKLVGVGVNGQENIEIGDNLTLANGKLSSAATGGGVNGLESDGKGNLTVGKNLRVDGKLTLKSLVGASNPDGDITKELGGGSGLPMHVYMVSLINSCYYIAYTTKDYNLQIGQSSGQISDFQTNDKYKELRSNGWHPAAGYYTNGKPAVKLQIINGNTFRLWSYNTNTDIGNYSFNDLSEFYFFITKLF